MALNEDEPEPVEDLLEPDYDEMKTFQPIINKFKSAFFEGFESDNDLDNKARPGGGRGAARARNIKISPAHGSSQSSSGVSKVVPNGRGRRRVGGCGPNTATTSAQKQHAQPINEACLEDSDDANGIDNKILYDHAKQSSHA